MLTTISLVDYAYNNTLSRLSYNNTIHNSTDKTPSEIIEGCPKFPLIFRTKEQIFDVDECVSRDV